VGLAIGLISQANAGIMCEQIGATRFCSGDNGYYSHETQLGNGFSFGNDSQGNSWNTQRYGNGGSFTNVLPGPSPSNDDDE
jgi:hypothetical protein